MFHIEDEPVPEDKLQDSETDDKLIDSIEYMIGT